MRRPPLQWFVLRFPRETSEASVLAVLSSISGMDWRARVVFEVSADANGITHRLAVSPQVVDTVTGELRAAIPSLRLDAADAPQALHGQRLMWQLTPKAAALRTDNLPAISASLIASIFSVYRDEVVRLTWQASSWTRPAFEPAPYSRQQGRTKALRAKLLPPGMRAVGLLEATAASPQRTRHLMRRSASVLQSLATPFGHLVGEPPIWGQLARFAGRRGRYYSVRELAAVIAWPVGSADLDLPGLTLGASKRLLPTAGLARSGRILGTSNFAGSTRPVAITPTASTRGFCILGTTGTGKTSLLENLVGDDLQAGRGLAVIETNGDLVSDLLGLVPPSRVKDVVLLDPTDTDFAVGFNPLVGSPDASLVADQLVGLLSAIWRESWGPRTAQIAHMTALALARRNATLLDISRMLTDASFCASVTAGLDDPVGLEPDWHWWSNLPEREQLSYAQPLLNKLRQFTARPAIRAIIGQQPKITMRQVMAEKKILLVNLPKGLIGSETARLLGCLVLTSLWQAATERARLPLSQRHPFGLYVDEVQDFASAPVPWDEMFAQGRKYGLALTVAHQNLAQIPHELRETIQANARSKAVFALGASDAKIMERIFAPALNAADLASLDAYTIAALVALDDGSTARPVTLATPPPPTPVVGRAEQVRQASRQSFARPSAEVEAALRAQRIPRLPAGSLGVRPRRQP